MDNARKLFDDLVRLKTQGHPDKSPAQRLADYCGSTLGAVERLHFDYKEKANPDTPNPNDKDKEHLAKAVSGFANSGGGVLIWGIQDKTLKLEPIAGVQQFVAAMLQVAAHLTDPAVPNVDGNFIPAEGDRGSA